MNMVLKLYLSMSFSASLLILALLLAKRFLKNKISRQWQYYIWLIVILRLLLPFEPKISLMEMAYQAIGQAVTKEAPLPQRQSPSDSTENTPAPAINIQPNSQSTDIRTEAFTISLLTDYVWLLWLAAALGMLIRKITIYQSFIWYVNAGRTPVSDLELLDLLSVTAKQAGIKRPIELYVNPLVSSPLLIGFFCPCIVLPSAELSKKDFRYIVLHELTHCKRLDMFYKWLVQVTLCLHWFNPLVYLLSREITKDCEFSCDEAVLAKTGYHNAQDYGETLLNAMAAVGAYKKSLGAVTFNENKQLLKERLGAIMSFRKQSKTAIALTGALTLCIIFAAAFIGIYPITAAAQSAPNEEMKTNADKTNSLSAQAQKYYEANSLPLFQIIFSQMNEEAQRVWLDKLYADNAIAFFSVSVEQLDTDSPLLESFAQKLYKDGSTAFFSVLADQMSDEMLEEWLDRALEDKSFLYQSMLFDKLNMYEEADALEKEWDKQQLAEYQAVGVTRSGKNYYYQGQLVNIFLDQHLPDKSFYTLNMNPAGTVNIKIIREEDGQITGAAYMTEAEVTELFGSMEEPDDDWTDEDEITVPVEITDIKDGEYSWLGTYDLAEGDRVYYHVSAKTGQRMAIGFIKSGQKTSGTTTFYNTFSTSNQHKQKLEIKTDAIVWQYPAEPGKYNLFIHAEGGSLTDVEGHVTIVKSDTD